MFAKPKYIADPSVSARFKACTVKDALWIVHRREQAVAHFNATGYPASSIESWRYSDAKLWQATSNGNARPNQGDVQALVLQLDELPQGPRAVFINGVFSTAFSRLPEQAGVEIAPLSKALAHVEHYLGMLSERKGGDAFTQQSLALGAEGIVIRMEESVTLQEPLLIAHLFTGGVGTEQIHSRQVVVLKEGATAELIEYTLATEGAVYGANCTTEIFLSGAAKLTHSLIRNDAEHALSVASRFISAEKNSRYEGMVLNGGARLSRVETQADIIGEGAHVVVNTVQLLDGKRHGDSTTHVTHSHGGATSAQHCRMILKDYAKGAFQGKTTVARYAQKTDAAQLNKNLLLHRTAQADAKPELEIYADDVKCAHGATTGEMDPMALFYLQARGLSEADARRLLVEAFADSVIEEAYTHADWKQVLRDIVSQWMHTGEVS